MQMCDTDSDVTILYNNTRPLVFTFVFVMLKLPAPCPPPNVLFIASLIGLIKYSLVHTRWRT